jgi:hypothetical protein
MDRLDNTDNSRLQRAMLLCLLFYFFWMSLFAPQPPVANNIQQNQETILDNSTNTTTQLTVDNSENQTQNTVNTTTIKKHSTSVSNKTESFSIHSDIAGVSGVILNGYTKNPIVQSWWGAFLDGTEWIPYSGGTELLEIGSASSMILATFDENKNMYPAYVSKEGETILIK